LAGEHTRGGGCGLIGLNAGKERTLICHHWYIIPMVKNGIYEKATKNKKMAFDILLPLIEFEFGFLGDDSPAMIQSPRNEEQFMRIFEICKKHGLLTSDSYAKKGENLFFRISKKGFKEIYESSGPFACNNKRKWAELILERYGLIGGYQKNKMKTKERLSRIMKDGEWVTLKQLCLSCRLLPGTVREGLKALKEENVIESKKVGKSINWRLKEVFFPRTLPEATAG
jgi:transcription initiation factor IIE alpha subunit